MLGRILNSEQTLAPADDLKFFFFAFRDAGKKRDTQQLI